jgi:hypothetical protein
MNNGEIITNTVLYILIISIELIIIYMMAYSYLLSYHFIIYHLLP